MKKQTKMIGGIAIGVLIGAWASVRAYNAGSVKGYMDGKAKGIDESFKAGYNSGWNDAVSNIDAAGFFKENENAAKFYKMIYR